MNEYLVGFSYLGAFYRLFTMSFYNIEHYESKILINNMGSVFYIFFITHRLIQILIICVSIAVTNELYKQSCFLVTGQETLAERQYKGDFLEF